VDVTVLSDRQRADLTELVHRLRDRAQCRNERFALLTACIPDSGHPAAEARLLEIHAVDGPFVDQLRTKGRCELSSHHLERAEDRSGRGLVVRAHHAECLLDAFDQR
jgi:hypothetical protein